LKLAGLIIGLLVLPGVQAGYFAEGDTGNWDFYDRNNASEHYAQLDANSSEQFYFGAPRLVLYCIQSQGNFGAFVSWNKFIDTTIHPIRLAIDQQPTLLMSWLAGAEGENSWLPAGRFSSRVLCDEEDCTGASRISMTRLDLIGEMLKAQSISVETTDTEGNSWSAIFAPTGMRMAAKATLGFCGINANAL
jgi:hypothetical protein|tara:strand:+ start:362 stop:934 length:573 start_codon:yes stop_codon:yes gene_type:complete